MSPERVRTWIAVVSLAALLGANTARAESATPAELKEAKDAKEAKRERLYLTSLSLLVDGSRRLVGFCEGNAGDAEFARFVRPLAERYVELSGRMVPTSRTAVVHPHLVLVVENLERALDAAAAGDAGAYQKRVRIAREELLNLEAVLRQLKLRLPEPVR